MQRRIAIPPKNILYSCKFQHFSKRLSGMKAMQVYNPASVMIINCRLETTDSIALRNSQGCMQVDILLCLRTMQCLVD